MSWGVEFDPVNVDTEPGALAELSRLGVRVPAVTVDERVAHGWNPGAYAELLGVAWKPAPAFPPSELASRLDRILESTQRLLQRIPDASIGWKPPERDRSLRDLAFHVFRLSLAFVDGMDLGRLPEGWLQETAPDDLGDGPAVARYGALVQGRLAGWFEGAAATDYDRVIAVYYGPQSGHQLLERTTWHAAQHLRQLHALVERLGVTPPEPLPAQALAGLPLPEALW
jgi:hypothetical protein